MNNPAVSVEFLRLYPNLATDPVLGRIGEIYWNTTSNKPRMCTNDSPVTWSDIGGGTTAVEFRTITGPEESAKQLTLAQTPDNPLTVLMFILNGFPQENGVDYIVSGNIVNWSGFGLDGDLTSGDTILLLYWV